MSEVRSTTEVSKAIRWFFRVGSPWKMEAVTAEWITDSAIEPDWSTTTMNCHFSDCLRVRE